MSRAAWRQQPGAEEHQDREAGQQQRQRPRRRVVAVVEHLGHDLRGQRAASELHHGAVFGEHVQCHDQQPGSKGWPQAGKRDVANAAEPWRAEVGRHLLQRRIDVSQRNDARQKHVGIQREGQHQRRPGQAGHPRPLRCKHELGRKRRVGADEARDGQWQRQQHRPGSRKGHRGAHHHHRTQHPKPHGQHAHQHDQLQRLHHG